MSMYICIYIYIYIYAFRGVPRLECRLELSARDLRLAPQLLGPPTPPKVIEYNLIDNSFHHTPI